MDDNIDFGLADGNLPIYSKSRNHYPIYSSLVPKSTTDEQMRNLKEDNKKVRINPNTSAGP